MHMLSEVGSDNKKTHADISMELGKNVHYHESFEYWSIFQDGGAKMATTINVNHEMKNLHHTKKSNNI